MNETTQPAVAVVVVPLAEGADMVSPSDMLMSALKAVVDGCEGSRFVNELHRRLKDREAVRQQAA